MAQTSTDSTNVELKWRKSFIREWNRGNLFSPYMGKQSEGMRSIIHQIYELKDGGETITLPLVASLSGSGVTGGSTLQGNEEAMDDYGHSISIDWARNAIALNKKERRKSAADQLEVVRPLLTEWANNKLRDDIIQALGSVDGVNYGSATETQKDTWQGNNSDRVLFGALVGNASGDQSVDLAKLDSTADKMDVGITQTAKRLAKAASPKIRPVRVDGGREYFVMFHGSRAFRDLKNDSVMTNANREARSRDHSKNPLFQDGDLIYDGIIHREVPEIDTVLLQATAGASSSPVAPSFLCGAQALGYAIGQLPKPTTRSDTDYGFIMGRGVEMCYAVSKTLFNGTKTSDANKDWGVVTVWANTPADA